MHQLIMSRKRATRPSCAGNLGYVSGCVLAACGWHMSHETPTVLPNSSELWKTRDPSSDMRSVSAFHRATSCAVTFP
jgi:hypothetical protein